PLTSQTPPWKIETPMSRWHRTWVRERHLVAAGQHPDLDVHPGWQAQSLVERFDGLAGGLQDVDQPLVRANLELLARFAVDVRAAQHRIALDACRQRNRPVYDGAGPLGR